MIKKLQEFISIDFDKNQSNDWNSTSKKKLQVYIIDEKLGEQIIGFLSYKNRNFIFEYAKNCVEKIEGLDNFRGEALHSFFSTRIPFPDRANVSEEFKQYKYDPIEILGHLGAKSALSKYKFKAVAI